MAVVADDDPLLPWLRSIRKVKQTHAEDKSKILPHVSDCYKEFRDSVRYRNDPRFLRICVQLADCSPDPLKVMIELDERGIGHSHALFYEAYATCLEAKRRFGDANNVYKRGLASLAQPSEKLINSYKVFRDRMDTRKKRKQDQIEQHVRKSSKIAEEGLLHRHGDVGDHGIRHMEACQGGAELPSRSHLLATNLYTAEGVDISFEELRLANACKKVSCNGEWEANPMLALKPVTSQSVSLSDKIGSGSFGEETIQIRNFAAEVITGKEKDVEDARHHGLVDPTINTKEALQDILSMFRKPLDIAKDRGKSSSKRLVSVNVAAPLPFSDDNNREIKSPNCERQMQPLEFSVFKDDEQDQPQVKASSKPAALFPLFHDENKMRSPLGSLQSQSLDLCVFKDDEQEQLEPHCDRSSTGLSHFDHEGKRQTDPLLDGLKARPSEFCVFKDDEFDQEPVEPSTKLAQKGKNLSVLAHSDKVGNKPSWEQKPAQKSENSGFFVFKDEGPSEGGEDNALSVYRDKENIEGKVHSSKSLGSKHTKSDLSVLKYDTLGSTSQEEKARSFCHDADANMTKGNCLGTKRMLVCGTNNLFPQSPLYQP